jgi:hypothetical protein
MVSCGFTPIEVEPKIQTLIGFDQVTSVCTTRHSSNILTGIFIRSLRDHFSNPNNLEFNGANLLGLGAIELQNYVYAELPDGQPDLSKTMIQIKAVWEYNSQDIQRRPALYVQRNAQQTRKLAIGDGFTAAPNTSPDGTVRNIPGRYQTRAILGSHTVFCVGGSGAEAELLGQEVFNHFHMFAQTFRREFRLHQFVATEIQPVSLLDEFDKHFVVPVVLGYVTMPSWRVDVEAPWLKTVAISVNVP